MLCFPIFILSSPSHLEHESPYIPDAVRLLKRNSNHDAKLIEWEYALTCLQGDEEQEIPLDNLPISDDLRRGRSAGLGIELETLGLQISPVGQCSRAAKGQGINGVRGRKWKLTADIIWDKALDLEYIIDGTAVKIGSMEAHTIATEIERHHVSCFSAIAIVSILI
jgi:hypothetical protein